MRFLIAILMILVLSATSEAAERRFRLLNRGSSCEGPGCGQSLAAASAPEVPKKPASVAPDAKKPAPKADPVPAVVSVRTVTVHRERQRIAQLSGLRAIWWFLHPGWLR